jgi:hypothetical protein
MISSQYFEIIWIKLDLIESGTKEEREKRSFFQLDDNTNPDI